MSGKGYTNVTVKILVEMLVATAYLIRVRVGTGAVMVTPFRVVAGPRTLIGAGVIVAVTMLVEVMVAVTAARVLNKLA